MTRWGAAAARLPAAPASRNFPGDDAGWRGTAAAIGLSAVAVICPIAVTAMAATSGFWGPPLAASGLFSAFLHFGGGAVAGWYPLYLLAICYAGFRFGVGALLWTAAGSVLGFAAVVLSSPQWQQQPLLAIGLLLALALLPAVAAGQI